MPLKYQSSGRPRRLSGRLLSDGITSLVTAVSLAGIAGVLVGAISTLTMHSSEPWRGLGVLYVTVIAVLGVFLASVPVSWVIRGHFQKDAHANTEPIGKADSLPALTGLATLLWAPIGFLVGVCTYAVLQSSSNDVNPTAPVLLAIGLPVILGTATSASYWLLRHKNLNASKA